VYVRDVALFYLFLAEAMEDKALHGEAFNYSTESQLTVLDITRRILAAAGREDLEPVVLGEARGEIPHQYLSAGKARRMLGWSAGYTIEAALAETVAWYRTYLAR
jgi:CDP-glucose 4,6-dehydratase